MSTGPVRRVALGLALAAMTVTPMASCGDEPVTLPETYNTGRYRQLSFTIVNEAQGDAAKVVPLNGMDGSPLGVVSGDKDLTTQLWGRTSTSPDGPDGAHVRIVRVGTDSLCDLSLSGIFPDASADPNDPANYDFGALDAHVASAEALNTARVMWQAAFKPGETCKANGGVQTGSPIANQAEADRYAIVAFNTMRHLRTPGSSGQIWDQGSRDFKVSVFEFADDPVGQMGYPSNSGDAAWTLLFQSYANVAARIKEEWPDQTDDEGNPAPRVYVGGMSFSLNEPPVVSGADKHPVIAFIDYCKNNSVPLDNLSVRTKTATPRDTLAILETLREYLLTKDMPHVKLTLTGFEPDYSSPEYAEATVLGDPKFKSAHLGAFQTAVRLLAQDVPVTWALAGRTHRVYGDLGTANSAANKEPIESLYFDSDGDALPAFMAMYPFRQVVGHQRFLLDASSNTDDGFVMMASKPTSSDETLHIVIANANVGTGNASMTYDLRVENWVLPPFQRVDYRLATLDRNSTQEYGNKAQQGFFFGETGTIDITRGAGFIRFVHEMAVPSVHYLTLTKSQ